MSLWQTVKTQMKCRICGISPGPALFTKANTNVHDTNARKYKVGNSITYSVKIPEENPSEWQGPEPDYL